MKISNGVKLIYIANVRLPTEKAHGIQIMKMCEAFANANRGLTRADADKEVEVIIPTRANPNFENVDPFEYYGVEKNFKITKLRTIDPTWLMWMWGGLYIKIQASLFILKLNGYLSRAKLENTIFYTRDEYLLPILQRFAWQNRGLTQTGKQTDTNREEGRWIKLVWEAHTLPKNKSYYLKFWLDCFRIITISRGLKEELVRLGVAESKILAAPDGVDLAKSQIPNPKSQIRKELGLPSDKKIVMYTGHLYDWKGAGTLLDTARNFQFPISNFQTMFIFVGGTEHDIAEFKKRAQGAQNVLILGHQPPSEIPKYLASADVLVLPNSGKFEISRSYTSPLKLFEYMAAGKPIVASNLPSIREVLDEASAVFFQPDAPDDLAEKIEKVLSDKGLASRLALSAREKVRQYNWDRRANKILNFFQGI